jgi:hypothetical protein
VKRKKKQRSRLVQEKSFELVFLRFILPNYKIRNNTFVHPASHATSKGKKKDQKGRLFTFFFLLSLLLAPPSAIDGVIYGNRFRLKENVDISWMGPAAQVVATAMKKYGMFLADGGNIALTGASDGKQRKRIGY